MRIERLDIHNLTSLRHVALDLTTLPEGLVAITGENGSGKTTLLESVIGALYRTLPSRDGELMDYATDKDGAIDVRLSVEGVGAFRARVNLDGVRRTSDAVLEHQGTPITDGKVSTYDVAIRQRFPSLEVLLASAMAVQNKRGNFIGKKPRERKELFADLLALSHLEHMSQTAKVVMTVVDGYRERWSATRTELARTNDPALEARYAADANRLAVELAAATHDRARYIARIEELEAQLDTLTAIAAQHVAATDRASAIRLTLQQRTLEAAGIVREGEQLEATYQADLHRLTDRVRAAKETAHRTSKDAVADLDKRITANRQVLAQADEIRAAVTAMADISSREQRMRSVLDATLDEHRHATDAKHHAEQQIAHLVGAEQELRQAQQTTQLISTVPFGAACAEAGCRFLSEAIAAQGRVPDLERTLAPKPALVASLAGMAAAIDTHQDALTTLTSDLQALAAKRSTHQALAALADKVTVAETRLVELDTMRTTALATVETRLAELTVEQTEGKAELATRRTAARTAIEARATATSAEQTRLKTELATTEGTVAATADGHTQALALQHTLAQVREQWDASGGILAALAVEGSTLAVHRRAYAEARERIASIDQLLTRLDTERLDWQQLQRALGRDGVPVLEMDAAGPHISELTNTLLAACFGPRFSVELVTQQAKASGSGMKESFALLVTDNERGGAPREVGDLSGGEQVIVSEALMNGIALYMNQRAPMPIRTCWRDETTGALDPENAARYFQMLRQVQTLGSYHHIFFVTHNPAIAAQADAQLHVADGTAVIKLPPYDMEAAA